jgi:hypothetical protein
MMVEPHIHPLFDPSPYSPAWLKRLIPEKVMVGFMYLLGLAFMTGAGLGLYEAVVTGSCAW